VIEDEPLRFEPGWRYEYSNSNYLLLGVILEKPRANPMRRCSGRA
jgi:CubicO group peptidase (beta-lactamase class C family)